MKNSVKKYIEKKLNLSDIVVTKPKDSSFGHFSTPVSFSLAKELKKSPNLIAADLAKELFDKDMFDSVSSEAGYINFKLSSSFINKFVNEALLLNENFASSFANEVILLEYISANPTGPLHIGHARGAVFGDVIARVGRHLGYKITTEYYVNDAGNQITLLGESVYYRGRELFFNEEVIIPDGCYKGDYIVDIANNVKEYFGVDIFSTDKNIEKIALYSKDLMLNHIKNSLKSNGIIFDNYVSEKSLYDKWNEVESDLQKNDALYTDEDGKIWLKSSLKNDAKDRVVVRENKIPTYLAGDIIYHRDKFQRSFDRYINIWGADHHGYIDRVKASIEFLGYDSQKLEILLAQMVALLKGGVPYKMSKRAGNFILMDDVVEDIGIDSLRFMFLTKKSDTHLEFDVELMRNNDSSNPVFYVNYAHARIKSIFRNIGCKEEDVISLDLKDLSDDEKDLLFNALMLPEILKDAFAGRNMQLITEYLLKLATNLHRFYTNNKVIGSEREKELLKILSVVALSIKVGLKMLGIDAKEQM